MLQNMRSMNCDIFYCVANKLYKDVDSLLSHGSDVNQTNKYGNNALWYSVANADYRMASLLVSYGADPYQWNTAGLCPLTLAVDSNDKRMVKILLNGKPMGEIVPPKKTLYPKKYEIFDAIRNNDYENVQKLVAANPDLINATAPAKPADTCGASALQVSMIIGWHPAIASFLLDHGADVDYPGYNSKVKARDFRPVLIDVVCMALANSRRFRGKWYHTKQEADAAYDFLLSVIKKVKNPQCTDSLGRNALHVALSEATYSSFASFPSRNFVTGELEKYVSVTPESVEDFSRIINLLLDYGVGVDSVNSYSRKNMNEEFNGLPVWDTFQDILKSRSDTKV